jgi:hypothetical protein
MSSLVGGEVTTMYQKNAMGMNMKCDHCCHLQKELETKGMPPKPWLPPSAVQGTIFFTFEPLKKASAYICCRQTLISSAGQIGSTTDYAILQAMHQVFGDPR